MSTTGPIITPDHWSELRRFTEARISLGRCGVSLPLAESLAFRLAHAQARDAVWQPFRVAELAGELEGAGLECLRLQSAVADRGEYLTRPDKGRRLGDASRELLAARAAGGAGGADGSASGAALHVAPGAAPDVVLVVGDGLSSRAVHETAGPLVRRLVPVLRGAGLCVGPVCLVENARVAVADEVGALLGARVAVILIGERPGLTSPNSLGIYLTHGPRPGATDEARNCISNVRPGGLSQEEAVRKLAYLLEESLALGLSGVGLKDKMPAAYLPFGRPAPPALEG
jgi:ethanolamine ammonia-lyase small subunit